jgi:hypothetical protein
MPSLVIVDDLVARWRPLTVAETIVANAMINDAMTLLSVRRPTLLADVTAGLVTQEAVVFVVSAMVLRVLKNPESKRQESIDDYAWTRDTAVSSGALYVSDDELRLLTGVVISRVRGVRLVSGGELL